MDGILSIDKPKGWTSFDVVAKVRGVLWTSGINKPKVGHTGTLDPLATGLLVILVGNYTKKATELTKLDKAYEVAMKLGQTSSTGDEEGEKEAVSNLQPSKSQLEEALKAFKGDIMQIPPVHSAIKVNGQRAYKLARAGKEVRLEPRLVKIHSIKLSSYKYPEVKFTTEVSSGTYIRSLVDDIGRKLGTGAYMSDLRRTKVGKFKLYGALNPKRLSAEQIHEHLQGLD